METNTKVEHLKNIKKERIEKDLQEWPQEIKEYKDLRIFDKRKCRSE